MLEVYNNKIIVKDQLTSLRLIPLLTFNDKEEGEIFNAYELKSPEEMMIPKGYLEFLPDSIPRVDKTVTEIPEIDTNNLEGILDGITLRDDQVIAVTKMTKVRRGIVQLATGAGKTECMSAFLKNFYDKMGYYPKTLILEPTLHLVESTVNRMQKYGIPAIEYSKCRGVIEGVVITHPMSLNNDIKKDKSLLSDVKVFLTDECHRMSADTWRSLIEHMDNVEFVLGVSASAIYPTKVPVKELSTLTVDELKIVGATGNVILDIPPSYYISKGILATPVLLRVNHEARERVPEFHNNWHLIAKKVLQSPDRTRKISEIGSYFASSGFKTLILVATKVHAYDMLRYIGKLGLADKCRASFGGGEYYRYDPEKDKQVKCKKTDNVFKGFESGEFSILIGTSHIYEGMDVPNLDTVILASPGKNVRRIIQGIGRAIRKSKTGKYAYVVDFTDHTHPVLARHSLTRAKICRDIIGVPEQNIYGGLSVSQLKHIVMSLEIDHFNNIIKEESSNGN